MRKVVTFAAAAGLAATMASAASAETTLRAISFIPKNHPVLAMANEWVEQINKGLKGQLKVNFVGGPEVINRYQQIDAVKNGVVDIVFTVTADLQDKLPEVSAFTLSRCTVEEERKNGFYEMMAASIAKLNIKYLGRVQYGNFYLWTDEKPESLADLKGLKMRTGSLYDKFMRELGMVAVTINSPEVYTALERGVVDGFGWPNIGPRRLGWTNKVKYVIDLPFFGASNMAALVNMDKWKSLPADVQKKMMDITIAYEPKMVEYFKKLEADEWKKLEGEVTRVKFSPEENKKYLDTAYAVEWKAIAERVPADTVDKLKKAACN